MYCVSRNKVTCSVRNAKKEFEKNISIRAKDDPKHFWKYVKSKTTVKSTIGELKNDNGEFTEDPLGKANILNNYFSSVFTRENPSKIPDVHDRNYSASLEHIYIYIYI